MANVINMPKLGFDMAEGTLVKWVKQEGEAVEKGELIAEIETDKATVEVETPYSGTVRKLVVSEGSSVPVSMPIAVIGAQDEEIDFDSLIGEATVETEIAARGEMTHLGQESVTPSPPAAQVIAPPPASTTLPVNGFPQGVRASPLARRISRENQIDLGKVRGSGPQGRIVKRDIEAYLTSPASATPALSLSPTMLENGQPHSDKVIPLTRLRKAIGRRMLQSTQELPQFYVTHQYNLDELMDVRKQVNLMLADSEEKLSVNDFILKATALTLRQFPNLNASLDGDHVVHHGRVNLGVAVSVEGGLLTVVCADADQKSIRQISKEIGDKAGRAREGKVHTNDISGSTFSVSNLGMFDVSHFTAIINPPEAAILAVGSAMQVPVVQENELVVGWRMNATLTTDHRVSDGAEAARFMQALAHYLENPLSLMI
ncbi:MAG: 2-oxo acid dehydrogenase subunit E2 [Chloroflexi bacterium]|nr:2-oxo acid dehydrogenase subunit E2 [Chloroflexota bacterium]